jgi:Zinc finger, C3HC4 type (RING finger)
MRDAQRKRRVIVPVAPSDAPPPRWGQPAAASGRTALGKQSADDSSCIICFDSDAVANVRFVPCGHIACADCVAGLRKRALFVSTAGVTCPFCRAVVQRYDAPDDVDIGQQPKAPSVSLAVRANLPPLEVRRRNQLDAMPALPLATASSEPLIRSTSGGSTDRDSFGAGFKGSNRATLVDTPSPPAPRPVPPPAQIPAPTSQRLPLETSGSSLWKLNRVEATSDSVSALGALWENMMMLYEEG